mmetsp:Transcript_59332/g.150582  ORF Transcript_59332/g.150582 Transcript_59332/m.150582 type:complete len:294 (-) Transcript_59332:333-1214(-)
MARFPLTFRLLVLCLAACTIPQARAACTNMTCSQCTETECSRTHGCIDHSAKDYDARFCLACGDGCSLVAGETMLVLDPEQGCSTQANVIAALLGGAFGGIFAGVLPCCMLCNRTQSNQLKHMLSAPPGEVKRTQAVLKRKFITTGRENSSACRFDVEFQALRQDGKLYIVSGSMTVMSPVYDMYQEGAQVEVAYVYNQESEFVIVENAKCLINTGLPKVIVCIFCTFSTAGVACGLGSIAATGCFLSILSLAFVVGLVSAWGHFLCVKVQRCLDKTSVTVSPAAAGQVYGAQ